MGDKHKKESNQGASWTLLALRDAGAWLKHPHSKCAELFSWLLFIPRDMQLSWAPLLAPESEAAQSVSTLNPLKSRT